MTEIVPRLFSRALAARYLGISVQLFDAYRAQGLIEPVPMPSARRLGERLRTPLFDVRDLDQLIDRWKGAAIGPNDGDVLSAVTIAAGKRRTSAERRERP
jgi:hypothetical protein